MAILQFSYPFRFQGVTVAEIDASVEIDVSRRYEDDWSYGRIMFHDIDRSGRVVDVIGGERGNVLAYLNRSKGIQEDIAEAVHDEFTGQVSYDREMATSLRAAE